MNSTKNFIPVKILAGKIMLYFHYLHRIDPFKLSGHFIYFDKDPSTDRLVFHSDEKSDIHKNLKIISSDNDVDILNAIEYLLDKGLLEARRDLKPLGTMAGFGIIKLTASGVDLVEGIEKSERQKQEFSTVFNLTIQNNITIDNLLKAELSALKLF